MTAAAHGGELELEHEDGELERHDGYKMVEAARPDLRPGESVSYVPDRYCEKCQQARGIKRCSICGSDTVMREDLGTVQLPDLPGGAALDLSVGTVAEPARPAVRRVIADVPPPFDPQGDAFAGELEAEPEQLEAEPEQLEAAPPRRAGLIERAFAARAQQDRAEEEARARSAVLDQAARARAPEPAEPHDSTPPRRSSILELNDQRVGSLRSVGRERGVMESRQVRSERDDAGREVQRTLGRTGRKRSIEEQLVSLWEDAKIDRSIWTQLACAFASAGQTPDEAADSADRLYMELIQRENMATARSR